MNAILVCLSLYFHSAVCFSKSPKAAAAQYIHAKSSGHLLYAIRNRPDRLESWEVSGTGSFPSKNSKSSSSSKGGKGNRVSNYKKKDKENTKNRDRDVQTDNPRNKNKNKKAGENEIKNEIKSLNWVLENSEDDSKVAYDGGMPLSLPLSLPLPLQGLVIERLGDRLLIQPLLQPQGEHIFCSQRASLR